MTALDMIMLVVIGGGAVFGFMRGFVQEVLSLLAWIVAVVMVRLFLAPVSDLLGVWIGTAGGAAILAFVLLFAVSIIGGRIIARRIGQSSRASVLGPVDRVLGGGFGALKGLIGATLVFLAFSLFYNMIYGVKADRPGWMRSARSYALLDASGRAMSQFARRSSGEDAVTPETSPRDADPE